MIALSKIVGVVVVPPEYDALEERVKAVRPRRYAGMAGSGASFAQALIPHIQIDGMDLVSMVKGFSTIGLNLSNAELAALINCLAESRGMTERVSEFDVSTCQRVFAESSGIAVVPVAVDAYILGQYAL